MLIEYAFLVGPFFILLVIAAKDYQQYLWAELAQHWRTSMLGVSLLIAHAFALYFLGENWFRPSYGKERSSIAAFLFPGFGYALLCFPENIFNQVLLGDFAYKRKFLSISLGVASIAFGYVMITIHNLQ